jgi:hypothetical protein
VRRGLRAVAATIIALGGIAVFRPLKDNLPLAGLLDDPVVAASVFPILMMAVKVSA